LIDGDTALSIAVRGGHIEVVKLLLKNPNIDVNMKLGMVGVTALNSAIQRDDVDIVKLLLYQPDIDFNGNYPISNLMIAIMREQKEIVELLLKRGVDINKKYMDGYTALMWAVERKNVGIINLLLNQSGIDIKIENNNGETALNIAENIKYGRRIARSKMEPQSQQLESFKEKIKHQSMGKI